MTMVNVIFSIIAVFLIILIVASLMATAIINSDNIIHFILNPFIEWRRIQHIKDTGELWMSLDQLISFSQAYPKKWELSTLDSLGYALYYKKEKNCGGAKIYLRRRDIKALGTLWWITTTKSKNAGTWIHAALMGFPSP